MPIYTISPQDVLMFRDGRPMEGGLSGHGARWPEPGVIFDALHAALHRAFPQRESWEHPHDWARSSQRPHKGDRSQRFGSLATLGPFPVVQGGTGDQPVVSGSPPGAPTATWFFPCPADVTKAEHGELAMLHPLREARGRGNLPAPLKYPLANPAPPSKAEPKTWWSKAAIETYLGTARPADNAFWQRELRDAADLYAAEWATGIAIDPATQTTGCGEAKGKIYSAEYLRLRDGVTFGIHATMPMKNGAPGKLEERIGKLFPAHHTILVGGQQRACQVQLLPGDLEEYLPLGARIPKDTTRIKWLLLSPAVFPAIEPNADKGIRAHPGGWLPTWVCPETGQVLLKAGDTERHKGESRDDWRRRVRSLPNIAARLVAARLPKPIVVTGWTEAMHLAATPWQREHGPRPTLLAVPAGAVYYFEADTPEAAAQLAAALNWHGPAGGYRKTASFQTATLIYDATWWFCEKFLDPRSRTVDQMVQAARSGRQNIAEGSRAAATTSQTELRLLNVARASLEELLLDYEDYLFHRHLPQWGPNSKEALAVRAIGQELSRDPSDQPDPSDPQASRRTLHARYDRWLEAPAPAPRANALICLIHQANYLLDQQISALEQAFIEEGGYSEQLATARLAHRTRPRDPSDPSAAIPRCPQCGKPMTLRTAKTGKHTGQQFWGCTAYPDCKGTAEL